MATILVQHLMNYINSYPIIPKVYIPLIHTLLEFGIIQDIDFCQRFTGLGNELQQTGHIFSVGLTIRLALHLEHFTGWTLTRLISSAMRTSPSVRYQLKNYLFVTRNTQREYIFCCNPSSKHSPHLLTRKYARDRKDTSWVAPE